MNNLSASFKLMLANVRVRILERSETFRGQAVGPFTFALHLLQTLQETDFAILEAFEAAVGQDEVTKWYQDVLAEMGATFGADEPISNSGAA